MTSGITPHLYRGSVFLMRRRAAALNRRSNQVHYLTMTFHTQMALAMPSHPLPIWRDLMSGVVRKTLAILVFLYLGASTADRAVGRVRQSAMATHYDAKNGQSLYTTNCSSCHQANGEGRVGAYPPLKGSGVVIKNDATKHIRIVLNGLQGAKAGGVVYASPMPPFGSTLDDSDIADIIDYERSSWGNHGQLVTAAQVAAERGRSK